MIVCPLRCAKDPVVLVVRLGRRLFAHAPWPAPSSGGRNILANGECGSSGNDQADELISDGQRKSGTLPACDNLSRIARNRPAVLAPDAVCRTSVRRRLDRNQDGRLKTMFS
jgi:hypothetical protein